MTELLVVLVGGLVVIAAATLLGPRLGIAAPLVLVTIGVAASFLPMLGSVEIDPEWILAGVLPPLLYSSAVSVPAANFRREFSAISGLSIVLVVGTALAMGAFFMLVVPDLGFVWGVALGAIVSPTDAVATSIIKKTTVSPRVVAMLQGESLLNDATALVVLRTAVVGAAAAFSFWGSVGTFAYSVAVAVGIGAAIGALNLIVRKRVSDPAVNTVITFAVPFAASVPANSLEASGLVAAVVAGLVTGFRAPRDLSAQNRLSDSQNWRTVELVLEGAVFLTMGVQIKPILESVQGEHPGVGTAILIAVGALVLLIVVRTLFVGPLLVLLAWRSRSTEKLQPRIKDMQERMKTPEGKRETLKEINERGRGRKRSERDLDRFAVRLTRGLATIQYFVREPLGWREGTTVVWAGMRGAITVAAAQTLPPESMTPQRPVLILIAFAVATLSLVVQGGTIGPLVRMIAPQVDQAAVDERNEKERNRLFELMRKSTDTVNEKPPDPEDRSQAAFEQSARYRLAVLAAQRDAILDARDDGTFDSDILEGALANIDSSQIGIDLRGKFAQSTGITPRTFARDTESG